MATALSSIAFFVATLSARQFWAFYREYTQTAVHTASAAALAVFGLLVFIDPLFAVLAIASYVCPPVVLYLIDASVARPNQGRPLESQSVDSTQSFDGRANERYSGRNAERDVSVHDAKSDDADADSDGQDTDTDTDSDGWDTDTDADSDGWDTDTDADSDGRDTDTDADSDGRDADQ